MSDTDGGGGAADGAAATTTTRASPELGQVRGRSPSSPQSGPPGSQQPAASKPRLDPNPSPTPSQKGKTQMKSSQTFKSLMWGDRKGASGGLILAVMYAEDGNNGEPVDAEKVLKQISKSGLGDDVIECYQSPSKAAIERVRQKLLRLRQKKLPDVEKGDRSLFKLSKYLPQHHSIYSPPSTLAFNLHGHQTVQQFYAFWVLTDSVFIVRHIMQHRVAVHLRGNSKKK